MKTVAVTATLVGSEKPLDAGELARACGAEEAWVLQLVKVGIIEASGRPADWRFDSGALQRALAARSLQRDFDASLDAAALILDMSNEIRRLKTKLRVLGVDVNAI
ncbi:MerR family transcriptional regulator [Pigmentiphaga sp. NML080357]|uniref:chaperone modulator CbpM n=1 Tax=Pigmentiphaga sp. NML080357 TaxID=2008675 RepID=UPI000B40C3D1|nr:chaperone modulator CbpM [Pigmentiphaga sp. NML080357]OVZ56319.1 MerR family transcriptional regulator [Pigmentiphaga sp. NML080357]